ncbi:hypothetical protein FPZ12_029840 [Amycolatopsis acidicola]|uniref:NACHT domain-containing protein n=1 Tax=Amycolatopsis acidicola TaxID=2596893 RepID=A0A5N0UWM5_9PSEU|nr:hypothetical protein [Amycolatopsis acidicola]KAA9155393.1 hypothetical protein FPZ12_029840 [Amycolatopsis acidicola]
MGQDGWTTANRFDGTASGPVVQAGSIGEVHFHGSGERAGDGVFSLLRAQVQAAKELPYRLPGARRPSLATVHVRQGLGNATEEAPPEQASASPVLDADGRVVTMPAPAVARPTVRPPSRTVRSALDGDDHLLITGGPGQGKSTLSLRLAADIADWWATGKTKEPLLDEPVLPVRVTAKVLAAHLQLSFPEALANSVREEYGALLRSPVDARPLAGRVDGFRWLLLVDALDEVAAGEDRDKLASVLAACAAEDSPYRLVVTTRPIEGVTLAPLQRIGATRYELQPFDDDALTRFAGNWFAEDGPGQADRFLRQIRDAHLTELARVPLLATIAAIVFTQHDDRPLPDNQYELYETYLEMLRRARPQGAEAFEREHTGLLEHLGRTRLETDESLLAAARSYLGRAPASDENLLTYLSSVGPLIIRGGDLSFLHHSFAEHLAATEKARTLPPRSDRSEHEFARLLHAAKPDESGTHARAVLLHYTRLRPEEADRLIESLHKGEMEDHLLAARLLARHVPASAEVVDAFLRTVRGWALTTQYSAGEILAQTSRAAHHPGLVPWLYGLLRDDAVPWCSKIEAAAALATRLCRGDCEEAVAVLRAGVDTGDAPIMSRLDAAAALAECDDDSRAAVERSLRSVLGTPPTSGSVARTAATILATFEGAARETAVDALKNLASDEYRDNRDRVEAATGLIEIGTEFFEFSAEVFRAVLRDRAHNIFGRREAALGLASLGGEERAEAAAALTEIAGRIRTDPFERIQAALALAELGPEHRAKAGELALAISHEPGMDGSDRWRCAEALARLGTRYRAEAVAILRELTATPETHINSLVWAADTLAELGPEFAGEAAGWLHRLQDNPFLVQYDRGNALGALVTLGEPYRAAALKRLRADLADPGTDPMTRTYAATQLVSAGPGFHSEAADVLLRLAMTQSQPEVVARAWFELVKLRPEHRDEAAASMVDLLRSPDLTAFTMSLGHSVLSTVGTAPETIAAMQAEFFRDARLPIAERLQVARELIDHDPAFLPEVLSTASTCLPTGPGGRFDLAQALRTFRMTGLGVRRELGPLLREIILSPGAPPAWIWHAVQTLDRFGIPLGPEEEQALFAVIIDETAGRSVRDEAAAFLAGINPEMASELASRVLTPGDDILGSRWAPVVFALSRQGVDVLPGLEALFEDPDAPASLARGAGAVLARLSPTAKPAVVAGLRRLAGDRHLPFRKLSEILTELAIAAPESRAEAEERNRAVFLDETSEVLDRLQAAFELIRLDPANAPAVRRMARAVATSRSALGFERRLAVSYLNLLTSVASAEITGLIMAGAGDPGTDLSDWREEIRWLPEPERSRFGRTLLADRCVPIEDRIPKAGRWGHNPLQAETEAAIREVLDAPESPPGERIAAAAALAGLAPRYLAEAAELLDQLARETRSGKAKATLVSLGREHLQRVKAENTALILDSRRPFRERCQAAVWFAAIDSPPSPEVAAFMLRAAERIPVNDRITVLYALRNQDGLSGIRALRDTPQAASALRWQAAIKLRDRAIADRAAAFSVLDAITADRATRPALRWRVAKSLGSLGSPGRAKAIAVLTEMMNDAALATTIRADAARVLAEMAPASRAQARKVFRGLVSASEPVPRCEVLRLFGAIDPAEADDLLLEMAHQKGLPPLARLRCAETLAQLRRDRRELAAMIAREVAHDTTVARHIRRRAATVLALLSDLCREEARALLADL